MNQTRAEGLIVLAATPLGNAQDVSLRLLEALGTADVVAAEDTRKLRSLTARLKVAVPGRVVSFYEGNESARVPELIERAQAGDQVLVVTDAGMPSVSDPGYRLVREALEAAVTVTALPGPSAVLTALVLSGLPVARFAFEGFLPRKGGDRRRRLVSLADEDRTMVFFEAPHRLHASLTDMAVAFGDDRQAAVARELTKLHEEVRRGPLRDLVAWSSEGVRGEATVVVAGKDEGIASGTDSDADIVEAVREAMAAGASHRDAADQVAQAMGLPRRRVYEASLGVAGST